MGKQAIRGKRRVVRVAAAAENMARAQERFLAAYAEMGTVLYACRASGVGRTTHYKWMEGDATYVDRFRAADEAATEALLQEARKRAAKSDTLLIFLIKGKRPEFKDSFRQTLNLQVGGAVPAGGDAGLGERALTEALDEDDG